MVVEMGSKACAHEPMAMCVCLSPYGACGALSQAGIHDVTRCIAIKAHPRMLPSTQARAERLRVALVEEKMAKLAKAKESRESAQKVKVRGNLQTGARVHGKDGKAGGGLGACGTQGCVGRPGAAGCSAQLEGMA